MNLPLLLRQLSTLHLLMISVALVSFGGFVSEGFKDRLILKPNRVARGQLHRLLTAGWLHGDFGHLAMNMFVLWMFATPVRRVLGDVLFLGVYVTAVPVAYLPTTFRYRNNPGYRSLGASGATAAIMLSAILLDATLKVGILFLPFRVPGLVFGIGYILYSVWHSWDSVDNINHDAHFSGALYGVLVTFLLEPKRVMLTITVFRRMFGL